jgi:hypothetical protein
MKFYVSSHDFQIVVAGPHVASAEEAAIEAFLMHYKEGITISPLIIVSERGFEYFEHEHYEDKVFDTCDILKKAGFIFEDE